MDYRELKELTDELLRQAVKISPNGKVQEAFGNMVNGMRGAGESERHIAVCLLASMQDGLRHENWPS